MTNALLGSCLLVEVKRLGRKKIKGKHSILKGLITEALGGESFDIFSIFKQILKYC